MKQCLFNKLNYQPLATNLTFSTSPSLLYVFLIFTSRLETLLRRDSTFKPIDSANEIFSFELVGLFTAITSD
jgi:hypothetical protein